MASLSSTPLSATSDSSNPASSPSSTAPATSSPPASSDSSTPTSSSTAPLTSSDTSASTSETSAPPSSTATSTSSDPPTSTSSSTSSSAPPSSATSSSTTPVSSPPPTSNSAPTSTSALPPSQTFSSPPTSAQASSTQVFQSTSDGHTVLVTSIVQVSGSSTPTDAASQTTATSKGFFENKGAVAGVFTVVGVVALAIFIVVITYTFRKRRAKKFDEDVAEAAAEAAAHAHQTNFDDDDFGYAAGRSVYTDTSHGTYSQQPLQPLESYNMSELPPFDPYAHDMDANNAAGVGATGLNRAKSQTTPYNAFAVGNQAPLPQMPMPLTNDNYYDLSGMPPAGGAGYDGGYGQQQAYGGNQTSLLEAAGLAGGAATTTLSREPSQGAAGVLRNRSMGSRTLGEMSASDHQHDAYGAAYQGPHDAPYAGPPDNAQGPAAAYAQQPQPYAQPAMRASYTQQAVRPVSMATSVHEDPYAAYSDDHSAYSTAGPGAGAPAPEYAGEDAHGYAPARDSLASLGDDEDYGYGGGRRVLKVANE